MSSGPTSGERPTLLRYCRRSFLVIITTVGCGVGVVANRARTQRDAVNEIQRLRGSVTLEYQEVAPRTWSSAGKPAGPEWLRRMLGPHYFDLPNRVDFASPPNEEWAGVVNRLPSVRYLLLSGPNISDQAMGRLTRLSNLWELQLT